LPSITDLYNGTMTEHDLTLHQQFKPLSDSESDSENESIADQGVISIPMPRDLLPSLNSAENL
jgi:hypothetical protein